MRAGLCQGLSEELHLEAWVLFLKKQFEKAHLYLFYMQRAYIIIYIFSTHNFDINFDQA